MVSVETAKQYATCIGQLCENVIQIESTLEDNLELGEWQSKK